MKKVKFLLPVLSLVTLIACGQSTTEIAKIGINSTVSIIALDKMSQPLGYGSGFIIDDELIATNVHVIEGSSSAYILKDGEQKKYIVSGYVSIDKANDLVILKVEALHGTKLQLGSETLPEIGEKIFAIGNPKGLNGTFSEGIISGIRNLQPSQVLQITAPISPGSSGGPVLNTSGQVIGISFASYTSGQNLNFAVPVKYLLNLKAKIGAIIPVSTVKLQPKSTTTTTAATTPNIKEGVTIRNIYLSGHIVKFSVKNNLPYLVSNIKILFLVYDDKDVVIDYVETTCFGSKSLRTSDGIEPYLAKSIDEFNSQVEVHSWGTVKARVLDFEIIEAK